MASVNIKKGTQVGFDDVLKSIAGMDTQTLHKVLDELNQVLASRRTIEAQDSELLEKIKDLIPASVVRRYRQLHSKQQNGTISSSEQKEMLLLTDFMEEKGAERVLLLAQLAKLRQQSLPELAKQLRVQNFHA